MKGIQLGACDYLLKPIQMGVLKNIWQHIFRKKINDGKHIESHERMAMTSRSNEFDDRHQLNGGEMGATRKRKNMANKRCDDQESTDSSTSKKARVIWSVDLHQKFVDSAMQIGFDSEF